MNYNPQRFSEYQLVVASSLFCCHRICANSWKLYFRHMKLSTCNRKANSSSTTFHNGDRQHFYFYSNYLTWVASISPYFEIPRTTTIARWRRFLSIVSITTATNQTTTWILIWNWNLCFHHRATQKASTNANLRISRIWITQNIFMWLAIALKEHKKIAKKCQNLTVFEPKVIIVLYIFLLFFYRRL